jgi:predicted AlkP superfamily pyrophosphatase or phosphodiesterase
MQLTDLNLPAEFLPPAYGGRSIANVPATIAALLDAPFQGLPPLEESLWRPVAADVERVILVVLDSLGWQMVETQRPYFDELIGGRTAVFGQITSIFPSTTVAALSSLWTGYAPAQHGLVGLRLLTPEYGAITQFIHFTPVFGKHPDALIDAGLDPETFLHVPGFSQQLAAAGVPTHRYKERKIIDSALSKMHGRGVAESYGTVSAADTFVLARRLLEEKAGEKLYVATYWSTIDALMHTHGWEHPSVAAEARTLLDQLRLELVEALSPAARRGTLLCLVADHGQITTSEDTQIRLRDHPQLNQMLLFRPAGEPRLPYFYARRGQRQAVLDYLRSHFAHAMVALPAEEALAAGLLGPEPHAPQALHRMGDVVGVMRDGYIFLTDRDLESAHKLIGRHGGMTRLEMAVPWLAMRLDG